MAEISISLSSLTDYKTINVGELGVIKVRNESSNQGLKRSETTRDLFKLQQDAKKIDKQMIKLKAEGKTDDDPEVEKLNSIAVEKLSAITELQRAYVDAARSRLFDDEDGKLVDELYDRASPGDIAKLFASADEEQGSVDES